MPKVFDASAIIRAWEYYPQQQFPGFWRWIGHEIASRRWIMAKVNLDEVGHKVPELKKWLTDNRLHALDVTNEIASKVLKIKALLGIVNDNYSQDGVNEADLIHIATCACLGHYSVNCEAEQLDSKKSLRNSKIPRVCRQPDVAVSYLDLLKCVREANVVFDDFKQ